MTNELFNTKIALILESDDIFSGIYEGLNNLAIKTDLGFGIDEEYTNLNQDINKLIEYGFLFASSEYDRHKQIALRITYISYILTETLENISQNYKEILQLLLSRIGNNASIPLIIGQKKGTIDYSLTLFGESILKESGIPVLEKMSVINNMIRNKFSIGKDAEIILNDNQTELLNLFNEFKYISFSGPTSFGKTFLLINYVIKKVLDSDENMVCIFILPTISLLSEVKIKFGKELKKYNLENNTLISTNPKIPEKDIEKNYKNQIFIFTQERLNSFLVNHKNKDIDILIIDEAYNIEDSTRGIIMLDAIKSIIRYSTKTKIIFSSPLVDNPEKFFEIFNLTDGISDIKISLSPVLQNKIGVYCNNHTGKIELFLHEKGKKDETPIKNLDLLTEFNQVKNDNEISKNIHSYMKIFEIIKALKLQGTTFVFIEAPKSMVNFSKCIIRKMERLDDKEINETSDFLKDFLHEDFSLSEVIKYGVIYYHGDLPNIVKDKLSYLIEKGKIKYIVSNQSLLQGVNFPIKNIIIKEKNDHTGISNKITNLDFKNLIGRAGRLLQDFTGNIFYFTFYETKEIKEQDLLDFHENKKFQVHSSIETLFTDQSKLTFFNEKLSKKEEFVYETADEFDQNNGKTLNYLILANKRDALGQEVELFKVETNIELITSTLSEVVDISSKIELPIDLLEKNKFINFEYQNAFYRNLNSRDVNYIEKFRLPKPGTGNFDEFTKKFKKVTRSLNKYFKIYAYDKFLEKINSKTIAYIYEYSLSDMIVNDKAFYKEKSIDDIIDENLDIIRSSILFKLSSHIACMYDIINYFLEQNKKPPIIDYELATYIDNGCYKPQTFEFLNLGLSRYSSIKLSRLCSNEQTDYINWIEKNLQNIEDKNILWEIRTILDIS